MDKQTLNSLKLSNDIIKNMDILQEQLKDCPDIKTKRIQLKNGQLAFFLFVDGLTDIELFSKRCA